MAPTFQDQDRLIVINKLVYVADEPQIGEVVMVRYPVDPARSFVKRSHRACPRFPCGRVSSVA